MVRKHRTRGQAIILFVVGMLGLLAMTGLAVDGGRLYVAKRNAQSAADAAAMAAGFVIVRSPLLSDGTIGPAAEEAARTAALERAAEYGYTNDEDTKVTVTIERQTEPDGVYYYTTVTIEDHVPPALIQLVYPGDPGIQAEAQSRARPAQPMFWGYTLVTTGQDVCPGLKVTGNPELDVQGGIFVNASCSAAMWGTGAIQVSSDWIHIVGGYFQAGPGTISPTPVTGVAPIQVPTLPEPACSGPDYGAVHISVNDGDVTLSPGTYDRIWITGARVRVTLEPGLYCLRGEFLATGGRVEGQGVMFYITEGDFKLEGTLGFNVSAPTHLVDANGQEWHGMLVYMNDPGNSQVFISGTPDSAISGTIFAPNALVTGGAEFDKCHFSGTSETNVHAQLICYSLDLRGEAGLTLRYDPSVWYSQPPVLEMAK
ncbi:MAG: hypothetical protein GXO54_02285 [Chloroflexi bacterium]|nr:hypothetical protein [Chloroflexota bacterium]